MRTRPLVSRVLLASALGLGVGGCAGDDSAGTDTDESTSASTTATATMTGVGSTGEGSSTGGSSTTTTGESSSTGDDSSTSAGTTTTAGPETTTTGDASTSDGSTSDGSTTGSLPEGCSPEAAELVELVNAYRGEQGKPTIPLSPSLCTVAAIHTEDLAKNNPHADPDCNLHSWSDAGSWSACCYTADHAKAKCMWDKPKELTVYPGNGFENAAASGGAITPAQALDLWKGSPAHNEVILNAGIWQDFPWGAVGAGFYEGYAVLWFGVEADPAG